MTKPNFKTAEFTLSANVADAGTFTVNYPTGFNNGDFENASGHYLVINGARLEQPQDIGLAFGTGSITVTNRTGSDIVAGTGHITLFLGGEVAQDLVARAKTSTTGVEDLVSINATRVETLRVNFGAPSAADPDGILNDATATDSAQTHTTFESTYDTTNGLDVPRNLTAVGTAGSNHVVTVTGEDEYGQPMSENLTLNGTTPVAGVKAFKKITTVAVAAGAAGDTFDLGWGDVLGLPFRLHLAADVVQELEDGAAATAGTKVAGLAKNTKSTATTADVRGTYDPNSAMDGDKSIEIIIRSDDPTDIGNEQYAA